MNNKKLFVCSIDGPDFCGKTTVASLIVEELRKCCPNTIIKRSRLPSDLITGAFTKILRNSADKVSDDVFALVYAADHLHHNITFVEKLKKHGNAILVQERSLLTTLIYQGLIGKAGMFHTNRKKSDTKLGAYAQNNELNERVNLNWMREINKYDRNIPDIQIILEVDIEELLKRKKMEQRDFDRFETAQHLKKQVEAYYNLPEDLKNEFNVILIKANDPPEEVAKKCATLIKQRISSHQQLTFKSITTA